MVGARAVGRPAVLLEAHGDLGLRVGAAGHGVDLVEGEARAGVGRDGAHGLEDRVDRAVAGRPRPALGAVLEHEGDLGLGRALGAAPHRQRGEAHALVDARGLVLGEGQQVLVEDLALGVGQLLEAGEDLVEAVGADGGAELLEALGQRVPPRVLAEHEAGLGEPHRLGGHYLVGVGALEHPVLVDAGLVGEGVAPDDRLVGLDGEARYRRDQARGPRYRARAHARAKAVVVGARAQGHHDLLEGAVARPLADAVDRALDLARARRDGGQRVGDREAEVVVAVHRDARPLDARHPLAQHRHHAAQLLGGRVADGVGDVDRRRPGPYRLLHGAAQEVRLGAARVLRRPLDVGAQRARERDALADALYHLVARHPQYGVAVLRAGRQEGVDARRLGPREGLRRALDVAARGAREGRHRDRAHLARDRRDRLEVAGRGDREARLYDVDAQLGEHARDLQLLLDVHRAAGGLLAVAQRRVEDEHAPALGPRRRRRRPRGLPGAVPGRGLVLVGHLDSPPLFSAPRRGARFAYAPKSPAARAATGGGAGVRGA